MNDICLQTKVFPTAPEGDLECCNGMPGSHLACWVRDTLLKKGYTCQASLQEDYGWGFYVDADGCSIWVAISYAKMEGEDEGVPEWHVGTGHVFAPWAFRQWFKRKRGRELEGEIYAVIRGMIVSHPEVTIIREN
jgi:hypothetical protein